MKSPSFKKVFIKILSILIISIYCSCNIITFYNQNNLHTRITEDMIKKQKAIIQNSNPIYDSFISHFILDNRLISIMGVVEFIPGVNIKNSEYSKLRTKAIFATSDVNQNIEFIVWCFNYAYIYNQNILKLMNKEYLIIEMNEIEIEYIKKYIK